MGNWNKIERLNFIYIAALLLLSIAIAVNGGNPFIINNILMYALFLIIIFYITYNKRRFLNSRYRIVRRVFETGLYNLIYLVLFVPLIFSSMDYIVPYFFSPADAWLAGIDSALLFNFPLFKYLEENFNMAFFNTILQIIYIIYFFLPLVVVSAHFLQKKFNYIEEDIFYISLGLYLCYIGYILVPAYGPRFYYHFDTPLAGGTLFTTINDMLTHLERNKLDAFPSAHIEMGLVVTFLVRKNKVLFPLFIVEFIGIVISTVLLRYHYIIDIIVGVVFFLIVYFVGRMVYKSRTETVV